MMQILCKKYIDCRVNDYTPVQCRCKSNDFYLLSVESLCTDPMDTEDNCTLNKPKSILRGENLRFLP